MGSPYSPPDKPMPLTVGALVNTLNDLVRDGNLTPESKVGVFVNDAQGNTGTELLHESVIIVGWGKYLCLSPCRAVVLEPQRRGCDD